MQETIIVKGMSCQHCVKAVSDILREFAGVSEVVVDLDSGKVSFAAEVAIDRQLLAQKLDDAGYELF
ncbi:MAG: heavy-metal-associated domain-containing protein [Deltaproteobacteria bacterium]|nr:heavy-metal-associated domain-containing protein [Deltaproteobacteria bacterium]